MALSNLRADQIAFIKQLFGENIFSELQPKHNEQDLISRLEREYSDLEREEKFDASRAHTMYGDDDRTYMRTRQEERDTRRPKIKDILGALVTNPDDLAAKQKAFVQESIASLGGLTTMAKQTPEFIRVAGQLYRKAWSNDNRGIDVNSIWTSKATGAKVQVVYLRFSANVVDTVNISNVGKDGSVYRGADTSISADEFLSKYEPTGEIGKQEKELSLSQLRAPVAASVKTAPDLIRVAGKLYRKAGAEDAATFPPKGTKADWRVVDGPGVQELSDAFFLHKKITLVLADDEGQHAMEADVRGVQGGGGPSKWRIRGYAQNETSYDATIDVTTKTGDCLTSRY